MILFLRIFSNVNGWDRTVVLMPDTAVIISLGRNRNTTRPDNKVVEMVERPGPGQIMKLRRSRKNS